MSRGQRFAFLGIALVIAIVAIVVLADSSEDEAPPVEQSVATATPTATAEPEEETPTATPTPTPTPKPLPVLTSGKVTELEFKEGQTVRFRVRSDVADHVHVHGYDLMKDVAPGKTITMSFKATITGIFEIEFEDAGEEIASLRVNP